MKTSDPSKMTQTELRAIRFNGRIGDTCYFKGIRWHGPTNVVGRPPFRLEVDGLYPGEAPRVSGDGLWHRGSFR